MLTIVVPCYNEAENLPFLVEKLNQLNDDFADNLEVIIVNNGSQDNSEEILRLLLPTGGFIRSLYIPENKGYGYGLIQGFNSARGNVLACTHADMQTDPLAVVDAYNKYNRLAQGDLEIVVKGRRINRPFVERFFTFLMQLYANFLLNVKLSDISAQPKVFSKKFWDDISSEAPYDFGLDLYILLKLYHIGRIDTVDVHYMQRVRNEASGGSGSWGSRIKLCLRMISTINKLARNAGR